MLQTCAAFASLSVTLRKRWTQARNTTDRCRTRAQRWRDTYKSRHSFWRAKARERKGMICASCSARSGQKPRPRASLQVYCGGVSQRSGTVL
jgi:hypothetical protein